MDYKPIMIKSDEARNYQDYILKELRKMPIFDDKMMLRKWSWFKIKIEVVFNHEYLRRDADNIIKLTNDVIFNQFLKVDDSRVNSVTSEKYDGKGYKNEFLVITITKNSDNRDKFKRE